MTTTDAFSIRDVILAVLGESPSPDPKAAVDGVLDRIPDHQLRPCLAQLLRPYVRTMSGRERRSHRPGPTGRPSGRWADVAEFSNNIRTWRVPIGDDDWKFLGDLTSEDCDRIAEMYGDLAAANGRRADAYTLLAKAIVDEQAARAGDLPDQLLAEIFA